MNIFIVQWCNVEEYDEIDAEIFTDLKKAIYFLRKMVETNYPKDHIDDLTDEDINQMFEGEELEIDHERLFPYVYKITKKRI